MAGPDGTQTLQTINVPRCKICVLIVLETLCKEAIIAISHISGLCLLAPQTGRSC